MPAKTPSTPPLIVQRDEGQGTPLVLLHGLGNNHKSWDFVVQHLDRKKWRIITLDLLGFGDSAKPSIEYTPEAHSRAVAKTLTALNIKGATVVGHSMGCNVAIDLAARHKNLVSQLLLFGAPLYKKVARRNGIRNITRTEDLYFSLFEVVKKNPNAVQSGGKIADDLLPFVKGLEITEETWPAYRSSLEHTIMTDTPFKQAIRLTIPMLFICGVFDFFIIRENIKEIARHNRTYTLLKNTLGPHEITPRQGRTVAKIINKRKGIS